MKQDVVIALAVLLAFYLAVHFLVLNAKPLFGDEVLFFNAGREILASGFPKPAILVHFPSFYYAIAASLKLFGASESAARLVPTLFGLFSLVVAYKLGSLVSSSKKAGGLLAVFILVASRIFMSYTTLVDMDGSAVTFFLLLETYLILKYMERKEDGRLLLALSVAFGMGLLFKLGTVIVPFVVFLLVYRENNWRQIARSALVGICIFLSVYTAYFMAYPLGFWTGFMQPFIYLVGTGGSAVREPLLKFLGVFFWNSSFPLVLLLGYSTVRAALGKDKKLKFIALCALAILIVYSLVAHKMERYFVPIIPMASVIAAAYLLPVLEKNAPLAVAGGTSGVAYFYLMDTYALKPVNIVLSLLPLVLAAAFLYGKDNGAERFLALVFGLYIGSSIFSMAVYATHDYVINECEGQREAASYIQKNLDTERIAFVDATMGFYLDKNYQAQGGLEDGIKSGMVKYYAQCKAWPNFSKNNPFDEIAEKYELRSFYVKSIKIHEFP